MFARGVDRKTLADAIGTTRHAIGMVITGGGREERWLSRENNQKAAKFLKVDAHWLFTGEGQMEPVTGVVNGSLTFAGSAFGSHSNNEHAPVDGSQATTKPIADLNSLDYLLTMIDDPLERATVANKAAAMILDAINKIDRSTAAQQPGQEIPYAAPRAPTKSR